MKNNRELPHIFTVKSSAGAGKTYQLALRYLQLLVPDRIVGIPVKNHISNIVAITFTNKAASEMRSRIIDWMKRIILDIPFEYSSRKPIDEILRKAGSGVRGQGSGDLKKIETEIRETIEKNFEDMLKNFYDFNVSTIDSFVNLTLKASAFKLNLPPDFDISTDSATYIDLVLQECLQKIIEDDAIREKFDRFLKNYIEMEGEHVTWVPKNFLRETILSFWKEEAKENKGFVSFTNMARLEFLRIKIQKEISDLQVYLRSTPHMKPEKRFLDALEHFSISNRFEFKGSSYFKRQTLQMSLLKDSIQPEQRYEALWQDIKRSLSTFVETVSELKFASYIEIYNLFKQSLQKEIVYQKRIILIEQLNTLLQRIIGDEHFVPEIYYALAERYLHFLVDEFQDTNYLQWKNIEILAEEALARGGTLFLVGDKKQSIYRWRGGKPELVDEVASQYRSYQVYERVLDENFRSSGHVVRFNNTVFDTHNLGSLIDSVIKEPSPESTEKIISIYDRSAQNPLDSKADEGYVYVEKIVQKGDDGDSKERFTKDEKNEITKDRFSGLIQQIRNRNIFRDSDITVLVRRREEAQFIVKLLLEMGISVDSEFTVNVKNNPLIKEMISFLSFVNSPDDDLSFAGFLTGSIFRKKTGLEKEEIIQWITDRRIDDTAGHLYKAFQKDYPVIWDEHFGHFFKSAGYLPTYEFVVLFLKRWDILTHFPEDTPFFLHICELIKEQEDLGENNLHYFLQFLNNSRDSMYGETQELDRPFLLKTVEGANAVKVMTIHKAKGLQSPVVILPFLKLTSYEVSDSRDKTKFFVEEKADTKLLYIKKDFTDYSEDLATIYRNKRVEFLLDELNNTYVACTRPEKELYILLTDSKRQKNHLIDYLFNLESLKAYTSGNVIEIGKQFDFGLRQVSIPTEEGLSDCRIEVNAERRTSNVEGQSGFDNFGNDIKWMEKIKSKFEEPTKISAEQLYAKRKGDVVHYILSLIKRLPDEDHEAFINRCIETGIARYGFHQYEEEIKETISGFFRNPRFREFFLPDRNAIVFTERELIDKRGETVKTDRIIIADDHIDVIDFKTGETHSRKHIEQIRHYAYLVRNVHPGKPVNSYLLYIDDGFVKGVTS
jgi:ATP-dependent exoDNAse (exonuclease V) beta subunit